MPKSRIKMKPAKSGGDIQSLRVGRKWTFLTIKLATKRLQIQTARANRKLGRA